MWKTFIISVIGLSLTAYLFKNKKWILGVWLGCFSLAISFGGTIQIPPISPSIQNSFNISRKIGQIEKDIKNLKLESAEIKNLTVTQNSGTALHVAGDAVFDKAIRVKRKENSPGELTLWNKNGVLDWKITVLDDNLVIQKLENGKWITKFSTPQ